MPPVCAKRGVAARGERVQSSHGQAHVEIQQVRQRIDREPFAQRPHVARLPLRRGQRRSGHGAGVEARAEALFERIARLRL
nr:hypothetical protein [Burkholderia pseudomallei]